MRRIGHCALITVIILGGMELSHSLLTPHLEAAATEQTDPKKEDSVSVVRLLPPRFEGTTIDYPLTVHTPAAGGFLSLEVELVYQDTLPTPSIQLAGNAARGNLKISQGLPGTMALTLTSADPMGEGVVLVVQCQRYIGEKPVPLRILHARVDKQPTQIPSSY